MVMAASKVWADLLEATRRAAAQSAGPGKRMATAIAIAVVAVVLAQALGWRFPSGSLFLLLVPPVLLSSTALGASAGATTLAIGVLGAAAIAWLEGGPLLDEPTDALRLATYVCAGAMTVVGASVLRSSVRRSATVRGTSRPRSLIEPLTPRETEVLSLAASGLTNAEIARRLRVSGNTVKSHLAHAYGKLGARNRSEAVVAGLHSGSIPSEVVLARAPEITRSALLPQTAATDRGIGRAGPAGIAKGLDPGPRWAAASPLEPEVR
jgi:DNA-binding CsgD family transcriptional regulator